MRLKLRRGAQWRDQHCIATAAVMVACVSFAAPVTR